MKIFQCVESIYLLVSAVSLPLLSQPFNLIPPAHQCRGQEGGMYTEIWITIDTIHPPTHCRKQPAAQHSHMHSLVFRCTDVRPGNYTDISITESQGHMALVSTLSACEQLHISAKVLKKCIHKYVISLTNQQFTPGME